MRNPQKLLHNLLAGRPALQSWIAAAIGEQDCLPPNPRRLKGLANLLLRMEGRIPPTVLRIIDNPEGRQHAKRLLVAAYVYQFHRTLFARWRHNPDFFNVMSEWCLGRGDDREYLFEGLEHPFRIVYDEQTATPEPVSTKRFVDPNQNNIFWIQPLVAELQIEGVAPTAFEPYLTGPS